MESRRALVTSGDTGRVSREDLLCFRVLVEWSSDVHRLISTVRRACPVHLTSPLTIDIEVTRKWT